MWGFVPYVFVARPLGPSRGAAPEQPRHRRRRRELSSSSSSTETFIQSLKLQKMPAAAAGAEIDDEGAAGHQEQAAEPCVESVAGDHLPAAVPTHDGVAGDASSPMDQPVAIIQVPKRRRRAPRRVAQRGSPKKQNVKQEQPAAEGAECNAAGCLPPSPQRRETVDPGDVAGSLPPLPQRGETADPVGGPRHRLTGKTIDFEARFALSKTPQHKHELHPMLLRCPVTEELDPGFVLGVRWHIQQFLELDMERGGSANSLWPILLAFLGVAVQAVEFFAGQGFLTQAHVKMGFRCSRIEFCMMRRMTCWKHMV